MKHNRLQRLTALLLALSMVFAWCVTASAADLWWTDYVDAPMEDWTIADGQVETQGSYVLFTSDTHRYTYLVKDLLAAANGLIAQDGGEGNVGLMAFGGDFANEKVIYDDNMSILKAALESSPGTQATYTKGNHEGNVSDEDFEALTGMSRIGETAVNADGSYYFYNFGAFNGTSQFLTEDIDALDAYLAEHTDKPVFIVSHYPIHYYNDRRSAKNADKLVAVLNQYPGAVFLWGHNHTEQDPNYGMIRLPGDIIQTGASADTSVEIKFTYACLGALRDGVNGANGLLAKVAGDQIQFRYIDLNNTTTDEVWTDAQGNENPVRVAGTPEVSSETLVDTAADQTVIRLANVQVDRPLVDQSPDLTVAEYSDKFSAGAASWDCTGTYDFSTVYTVEFTLTAEAGYAFAPDAAASVNKVYVGPMEGQQNNLAEVQVSEDGTSMAVRYTFGATAAQGEVVDQVAALQNGGQYVLAAIDSNVAASYAYDPTQHGEESMPDYAATASDIVIRAGKLVSSTDSFMTFTAQKDSGGYLLYSDASLLDGQGATTLNYLDMSTRGGELGIQADETAAERIYADWNLDSQGRPYVDVDGTREYGIYEKGTFGFTTDAEACNLRLYQVGQDTSGKLYNAVVDVPVPAAGAEPVTTLEDEYYGYTAGTVTWDAAGNFAPGKAYTATVTLTPKSSYAFTEPLTGRIAGRTADAVLNEDGTVTLTYTFAATDKTQGLETAVTAKKADAVTDGGQYVIVSGGQAMTFNYVDGRYLKAVPVTVKDGAITAGITADMIFTLDASDAGGYSLKNSGKLLAAKTIDNSPDTWGFTDTDASASAITFSYADGTLTVESTGVAAGPGGPPPASTASTLYLSGGHFNYSVMAASSVELYRVDLNFTDLDAKAYYYDAARWSVLRGIINGASDTEFDPDGTCTRAQAVTMIWRAAGCPAPETKTNPFTDVKEGAYYYDAMLWAAENKITEGVENDQFAPDQKLRRDQWLTMLYRFDREPEVTGTCDFTDVNETDYCYSAVLWGCQEGITNGVSKTSFAPGNLCSRCEAVTMLYRYLG